MCVIKNMKMPRPNQRSPSNISATSPSSEKNCPITKNLMLGSAFHPTSTSTNTISRGSNNGFVKCSRIVLLVATADNSSTDTTANTANTTTDARFIRPPSHSV